MPPSTGNIDTRTEAVSLALRTEGVDANNIIAVATEINEFIAKGSVSA